MMNENEFEGTRARAHKALSHRDRKLIMAVEDAIKKLEIMDSSWSRIAAKKLYLALSDWFRVKTEE